MERENVYAQKIQEFCERTFTGAELLAITDYLEVGVGATIAAADAVERARRRSERPS